MAVAALVAGCAASDLDDPSTVDSPPSDRFALIALTDSAGSSPGGGRELVAQAWYVEHASPDRGEVLRLLGVPEGSFVDPSVPLDTCVVSGRDLLAEVRESDSDSAPTRLLDAGELLLESSGGAQMLDSYYVPDVYRDLGGIAYDGQFEGSRAFELGAPITLRADGSDEVGEHSVTLSPPSPLRVHSVAGEPVVGHQVALSPGALSGGLSLSWGRPHGQPGDLSVVLYERRGFDQVATVRCVVADDGAFEIPEAALTLLPELGPDQTDRLLVQRLRAVSFSAPGISDGVAVAIARDWVHLE